MKIGQPGVMKLPIKDRSSKPREYEGALQQKGEPAEHYIAAYLNKKYDKVKEVGDKHKRIDYICSKNGKKYGIEGKTDTKIAETGNIPWEIFRIENNGEKAYISWGWKTKATKVIFFVPQNLELLEIEDKDARRTIWESWYSNQFKKIYPQGTITDEDRLTFFFLIPIKMLESKGRINRVPIGEERRNALDTLNDY